MKPKTSGNTPAILPGATFDCYETEYYQKFQLCSLDGTSTPGSSDGLTQGVFRAISYKPIGQNIFLAIKIGPWT